MVNAKMDFVIVEKVTTVQIVPKLPALPNAITKVISIFFSITIIDFIFKVSVLILSANAYQDTEVQLVNKNIVLITATRGEIVLMENANVSRDFQDSIVKKNFVQTIVMATESAIMEIAFANLDILVNYNKEILCNSAQETARWPYYQT